MALSRVKHRGRSAHVFLTDRTIAGSGIRVGLGVPVPIMSSERAIEIDCERDEHTNLPLNRAMTDGTVSSLLSRSITNRLDAIAMKPSPAVAGHPLRVIFLTNRAFADDG
jgi:hypothetical protein